MPSKYLPTFLNAMATLRLSQNALASIFLYIFINQSHSKARLHIFYHIIYDTATAGFEKILIKMIKT